MASTIAATTVFTTQPFLPLKSRMNHRVIQQPHQSNSIAFHGCKCRIQLCAEALWLWSKHRPEFGLGKLGASSTSRDLRWRSCVSRTRNGRRRISAGAASDDALLEGDVVEYPLPLHVQQGGKYGSRCFGVGAVTELTSQDAATLCHLEPLIMDDPPLPHWIVDEHQDPLVIPIAEVRRVQAWLSMRMVDDRISNPHGEHAEHMWLVEGTLSPDCGSPYYDDNSST